MDARESGTTGDQRRSPAPRSLLRIAVWLSGGFAAWLLLLDLGKAPLLPELEPSWIAAITHAAANNLQFGREFIYTYGPLGHLVFSTFSERLFTTEMLARAGVAAFYVLLLCGLGRELPRARRGLFLFAAFLLAAFSYQTMYLFSIVCFGLLLCRRCRYYDVLLWPALLFAAAAALVKLTFLWLMLIALLSGTISALLDRRPVRAAAVVAGFALLLCVLWVLAGQELAGVGAFLRTGWQVTSGYSRTMNIPAPPGILLCGIGVAVLLLAQLITLALHSTRTSSTWAMLIVSGSALFVAWKLGFTRADAHTVEFFCFSIVLAAATPLLFDAPRRGVAVVLDWSVVLVIGLVGAGVITNQYPRAGSALLSMLQQRARANPTALLHPNAQRAQWRAADLQNSAAHALPSIKERVGAATAGVFGCEQAIALLNYLHYVPSPTVQSYCGYSPALVELNAAFFRSDRAPEFVLFKLQPIDNRLAAAEDPTVLLQLAYDYRPITAEAGYLLLQRKQTAVAPRPRDLAVQRGGTISLGETLSLPPGPIWCELDFQPTLLGRLVAFLYQPPIVQLDISTADGQKFRRRILPSLSSDGFLIDPFLRTELDFLRFASGQRDQLPAVESIKVVRERGLSRFLHRQVAYRIRSIPPPPAGEQPGAELLRDLSGYSDIFSVRASLVRSALGVERFALEGRQFLLVHPVGEVRLDIPAGMSSASGLFVIKPEAYAGTEGVEFVVAYAAPGAAEIPLARRMLMPGSMLSDRGVQQFHVDLPAGPGGQLVLRTLPGPGGKIEWGWAGWADVRFH